MLDKHVQFLETAFIQQHGNTFTGCIFSFACCFSIAFSYRPNEPGHGARSVLSLFKLVTHKIIFKGFTLSTLFLTQFGQYTQVDFGCRKAMFRFSAPLRGALSIKRIPCSSACAKAEPLRLQRQMPHDATGTSVFKNLAIVLSRACRFQQFNLGFTTLQERSLNLLVLYRFDIVTLQS